MFHDFTLIIQAIGYVMFMPIHLVSDPKFLKNSVSVIIRIFTIQPRTHHKIKSHFTTSWKFLYIVLSAIPSQFIYATSCGEYHKSEIFKAPSITCFSFVFSCCNSRYLCCNSTNAFVDASSLMPYEVLPDDWSQPFMQFLPESNSPQQTLHFENILFSSKIRIHHKINTCF